MFLTNINLASECPAHRVHTFNTHRFTYQRMRTSPSTCRACVCVRVGGGITMRINDFQRISRIPTGMARRMLLRTEWDGNGN